jgi:hypothetical protein
MKRNHIIVILLICWLPFSEYLFAQSKEIIYARYKYTLGDSDTKNDAKKIAFIQAKRLCLEQAGTYIESNTEILDFRLSKDEIKTYTGGILKVEIVSEEFKAVDETLTLFMEVKADVDLREVSDSLKRVKNDSTFAKTIKEQEKQLQNLEDKIRNLQVQLSNGDYNKTAKIRQERKIIFTKIDALEKIKAEIQSKTSLAIDNIVAGMTPKEVTEILDYPRSNDYGNYNYGNVWIIFKGGIVDCIVDATAYRWGKDCNAYTSEGSVIGRKLGSSNLSQTTMNLAGPCADKCTSMNKRGELKVTLEECVRSLCK